MTTGFRSLPEALYYYEDKRQKIVEISPDQLSLEEYTIRGKEDYESGSCTVDIVYSGQDGTVIIVTTTNSSAEGCLEETTIYLIREMIFERVAKNSF